MLELNQFSVSTVSFVSQTEIAIKKLTEVSYGLLMFIVTLSAIVVGTISYAYTAYRLWQEEYGEEFAAKTLGFVINTIDIFADVVTEVKALGAETRALVVGLQAG